MKQNKLYGMVLGQGCMRGESLRTCDYPEAYGQGGHYPKGEKGK